MGFTLDKHLPPAEQPSQRDLSTFAYLQIAAMVSPDHIIVLNLPEFSELVAEAVKEQYPAFAKSHRYRTFSADKLLSLSKMIVRDPLGIMRKETATAALCALLPPPPAVPSMIYPHPPEWFLQMLANRIKTRLLQWYQLHSPPRWYFERSTLKYSRSPLTSHLQELRYLAMGPIYLAIHPKRIMLRHRLMCQTTNLYLRMSLTALLAWDSMLLSSRRCSGVWIKFKL